MLVIPQRAASLQPRGTVRPPPQVGIEGNERRSRMPAKRGPLAAEPPRRSANRSCPPRGGDPYAGRTATRAARCASAGLPKVKRSSRRRRSSAPAHDGAGLQRIDVTSNAAEGSAIAHATPRKAPSVARELPRQGARAWEAAKAAPRGCRARRADGAGAGGRDGEHGHTARAASGRAALSMASVCQPYHFDTVCGRLLTGSASRCASLRHRIGAC